MASRVIRKVRDMLDVDDAAIGNGKTLVYRTASGKHEYEAAGGAADLSSAVILAPAASARNVIQPTAGAVIAAIVRAHAAQSVDLTQWQKSDQTVLAKIGLTGLLTINPVAETVGGFLTLRVLSSVANDTEWLSVFAADYNLDGGVWPGFALNRLAPDGTVIASDGFGGGFYADNTLAGDAYISVRADYGFTGYGVNAGKIRSYADYDGANAQLSFAPSGPPRWGIFSAAASPAAQQSASSVGALWTALKAYGWLDAGSTAPDLATQAELDAHTGDTSDAHDASAISSVAAGGLSATDVQAALNELDTEKANYLVSVNTQTASYTPVLTDAGKVVEMNVAGANNFTVPLNATVPYPVGTVIELFELGAGQTTVVATGGVTIRSPGGKLKLTGQYSAASLRKRATDEWTLAGDLAA